MDVVRVINLTAVHFTAWLVVERREEFFQVDRSEVIHLLSEVYVLYGLFNGSLYKFRAMTTNQIDNGMSLCVSYLYAKSPTVFTR